MNGPEARFRGARFLSQAAALLLALGAGRMAALNPAAHPADYSVRHWDTEAGLPHNSVRHLYQSRDGYLWIGTQQGLARFDGLTFTIFTQHNTPAFPSGVITSFAETADGSLWIGTSMGLVRHKNGVFTGYTRAHGLKADTVNSVCVVPDGSLWIAGRAGITRWVDERLVNDIDTSAFDTLAMRFISVDREGAIWLTLGFGAARYRDGVFTRFSQAEGLPAEPVQRIQADAAGKVLAVSQRGLFRLEGEKFVPFEHNASLASLRVGTSLVDRAGNLWIGSVGGLDRFHGGKLTRYADRHGNTLGVVDAIHEDREGCLWVGTSEGLYRFTDRRAHSWSAAEGVTGTLGLAVKQARDGSIWASTWGGGVDRFHEGNVSHYRVSAPFSHETITAIYEAPDGAMWFGNRGSALDRLHEGKVTTFVYASGVATSRPVTAMFAETNGEFYVGISRRGLLRLHEGQLAPVPGAAEIVNETVWAIHRSQDQRLFIGTSKGIYERHSSGAWQHLKLPGLASPVFVRAFLEETDGTRWLATEGHGLVRWQRDGARAYGSREGMIDDTLFSVIADDRGALWVSSARGMARILKTEFTHADLGTASRLNVMTFGREDGLLSGSSSGNGTPAAERLADGRLLTATDKGIAVIDPREIQVNVQPPTVAIESIIADDRPLPRGKTWSIPAGVNRVEIRFTAMSLVSPQRLRFRYQLEGSDPQWVDAGHERSARYTHLAPGRYTFRVLACNNDGVWNNTGVSLAFTVTPFYYQTLWFRLACLVAAVAGIAGIFRLRVRQLRAREQALARVNAELDQRVKERTAELSRSHVRLVEASRLAGMAEVATGVLHNVGNVLNSVNISATLIADGLTQSRIGHVTRTSALLQEHASELGPFLTDDPRGRYVLPYLATLGGELTSEQQRLLGEARSLRENIDHIKEIVASQQSHARCSGLLENLAPAELMEDALRMMAISLSGDGVTVTREFTPTALMVAERHKVLQILINLVQNAKDALKVCGRPEKRLRAQISQHDARVRIIVADNGVGISPENLNRVFQHGFTTRANGHGFGLHSAAIAAKEMKGMLTAQSEGIGRGATFMLELPVAIAV